MSATSLEAIERQERFYVRRVYRRIHVGQGPGSGRATTRHPHLDRASKLARSDGGQDVSQIRLIGVVCGNMEFCAATVREQARRTKVHSEFGSQRRRSFASRYCQKHPGLVMSRAYMAQVGFPRRDNVERFSLGGAAHWLRRKDSAAEVRAGERKTYWANPLAPQLWQSPGDARRRVSSGWRVSGKHASCAGWVGAMSGDIATTSASVARNLGLWVLFVSGRLKYREVSPNVANGPQSVVDRVGAPVLGTSLPADPPDNFFARTSEIIGRDRQTIQWPPRRQTSTLVVPRGAVARAPDSRGSGLVQCGLSDARKHR
jgi:hypothetical protein